MARRGEVSDNQTTAGNPGEEEEQIDSVESEETTKVKSARDNMETLKRRVENFTPQLKGVLEKVQKVCSYAVEERSFLQSTSANLQRAIKDCLTPRSRYTQMPTNAGESS